MTKAITIQLDKVDEGLNVIASNIRSFVQDHYALMHQKSDWHAVAMGIFALEELVKYSELKHGKETAIQKNLTSVEVDERLFGHGKDSHGYKLKIAKDQKLIPLEAWTIHTGGFSSANFSSEAFDTDAVITATLRTRNTYVDWKNGRWVHGAGIIDSLKVKNFVDSVIHTLEELQAR